MKRKKILKALANLLRMPICKVLFYLAGVALVLGLSGAFTDGQTVWNTVLNILKSEIPCLCFLQAWSLWAH